MVEIKCPHCDEGIELDDDDFGFFECPFCEEEFEWNPESTNDDEELFVQGEFWFGSLVPFLTALLGIFFSYIVVGDQGWDLHFMVVHLYFHGLKSLDRLPDLLVLNL